jgi:hypothetical protein
MTKQAMLRIFAIPSSAAAAARSAGAVVVTAPELATLGAGRLAKGWVCPIFTVAFGSDGLEAPSGGSVMRAVSFFGAAARIVGAGV